MREQYFYIGREEALKHQSLVYAVSDTKIINFKDQFGENSIEFYGDNLPFYLTVLENDEVREATNIELYKYGLYELSESEFVKDDNIYNISDFAIPENIVKPIFNKETMSWEEGASEKEIADFLFNLKVEKYAREKTYYDFYILDLEQKNIPEDALEKEEVIQYMRSINPFYALEMNEIKRPDVFNKYVEVLSEHPSVRY